MANQQAVFTRANNVCELCGSEQGLTLYMVPESPNDSDNCAIAACATCTEQLNGDTDVDVNHWRCLNEAVWSPVPAAQVIAWRMLKQLESETWVQDLLEMVYLDEDTQEWAKAGLPEDREPTLDSNGEALQAGDNVHLIKDLNVKGANFTAKRGTPVRNIRITQNPLHIEGKVNGQTIVIIAAYTKKG